MAVVVNRMAREIPWRPGYRNWTLAGKAQGVSCSAGYAEIQPGSGAPLHVHQDADEILILIEGRLEVRMGTDKMIVERGHTIAVPAGTPHAFVALGEDVARFYSFLPRQGAIATGTIYLEGEPPAGAAQR